jgi:hypothetical protein
VRALLFSVYSCSWSPSARFEQNSTVRIFRRFLL